MKDLNIKVSQKVSTNKKDARVSVSLTLTQLQQLRDMCAEKAFYNQKAPLKEWTDLESLFAAALWIAQAKETSSYDENTLIDLQHTAGKLGVVIEDQGEPFEVKKEKSSSKPYMK